MPIMVRRALVAALVIVVLILTWRSATGPDEAEQFEEDLTSIRCDTEEFRDFADLAVLRVRAADGHRKVAFNPADMAVSARALNNSQVHDCQRLIAPTDNRGTGGPLEYGPLVALLISPERVERPIPAAGRVVAEFVNYDKQSYDPLGIPGGYSCLWLRFDPDAAEPWMAAIFRPADGGCARAEFHGDPQQTLEVHALRADDGGHDYPSTGRWMWSADSAQQFIGSRCGDAWCEIGPRGFVGTERIPTARNAPGRFDEQLLAVSDRAPSGAARLAVSGLTGVIVPGEDNHLTEVPANNYAPPGGQGFHVASMSFDGSDDAAWRIYADKFALDPEGPRSGIRIFLHPEDSDLWPDVNRPRRFRNEQVRDWVEVRRCNVSHSGSGTVRWAWSETDEGFWVPCDAGCCLVRTLGQ